MMQDPMNTTTDVTASTMTSNNDLIETIKLISADGQEFIIDRRAAMVSRLIKNMLHSELPFKEALDDEIRLESIRGEVLAEVCRYFEYRLKYQSATTAVPRFEFNPALAVDLLLAADFLDT
jgi:transcription elongation factor B subunit 1